MLFFIMTSAEIRQSFLDFFREKEHTIVPSESLLPTAPNLLFTNAGMNQFVPYFLGRQQAPYQPPRAADTQKCIRAGGKHNDLEDVGLDTYHHTFFEMLGNWSFGDYFKREAIEWAWELVVNRWGFPPARLYATVYHPGPGDPGAFDDEAHQIWKALFQQAGLDPEKHIVNGGRKDNFWMMGETGPCGPCSELHVDLTPEGDTGGSLVNADDPRCIEVWNLVFIQYNAGEDGSFSELPAKHVDTGMGLERVAGILQCTDRFQRFERMVSNYETDLFQPIFQALASRSGHQYQSTLPAPGRPPAAGQEQIDVAFRVIADHVRTLTCAIADGIQPGNTDRNHVLRRILRRAVRYGRTLGLRDPFLHELVPVVRDILGDVFPEITEQAGRVAEVIGQEEELFHKTLDRGIDLFEEEVVRHQKQNSGGDAPLSGDFVFKLSDTYGFPLDLTELMARERGFTVDTGRFHKLMEEQQERARAARKTEVISVEEIGEESETSFTGYESLEDTGTIVEIVRQKKGIFLIPDQTPFYAEMGGQVGDTGWVTPEEGEPLVIIDTIKAGPAFLMKLHPESGEPESLRDAKVQLRVDPDRRKAIQAHHTATHLFHWALHEVADKHATQKGSYVGPDRLRFDFNSTALTKEQLRDIERLVNERIQENTAVSWTDLPFDEARQRSDITQIFGEKYGDTVRVVQIGGHPGELDGFSMELCGGTHTRATGELGLFRILSEGAIAAGVRRIEAVSGRAALESLQLELETRGQRIAELEEELRATQKELSKERSAALDQAADGIAAKLLTGEEPGQTPRRLASVIEGDNPELLPAVLNQIKARGFDGVALLLLPQGQRVQIAVQSTNPAHPAQEILKTIAPHVGGRGGGKPGLARGAGNRPEGIPEALEAFQNLFP